MTKVKALKATARSRAGTGAARAVRREGRVPGVVYGDGAAPLPISLDFKELRQNIFAGHFLTSIYELEVDGARHRVIPRDYQLDPVRDVPIHVDFLRLGEGARIRVRIPVHVKNADQAPGVKRGGTVNIVEHSVEVLCLADAIPEAMRPSKDQPFYHLLAENAEATYVAYVSQQNLVADESDEPVDHPAIATMFDGLEDGRYRLRTELRH